MNAEADSLCEERICKVRSCGKIVNVDLLVHGICANCRVESILEEMVGETSVHEVIVCGGNDSDDDDEHVSKYDF
jgi:hypothetical protein